MQKSWSHLAAVSVIITAGINIITVLPFMVGATGDHLGFSKLSLGWFAAADTTGVMISGLSVYQLGKRWSLRGLVMTGLFVQMLLHLVSLLWLTPAPLIVTRLAAGWFGGLAYTAALSYFAKLERPELGFTSYIIWYSIISGILLMIYPHLLAGNYFWGYGILVAFTAGALGLAHRLFPPGEGPAFRKDRQILQGNKIGWVLVAFLFFQCANSSIFSFSERLGKASGLSSGFMGFSIGFSILIGLIAGFLVLYLARWMTYARQIVFGLSTMLVAIVLLYLRPDEAWFYFGGITLLEFGFSITLPNLFSLLASRDPSRSKVALGTITNWLGQGLGPALAALYIQHRDFTQIVIPGSIFLIFSMLSMLVNSLSSKRTI